MSTRALMACHVVLLSCSLSGCTIWSLPPTTSKVEDHASEASAPLQPVMNSVGLTSTDVGQLQRDQYCELIMSSPAASSETGTEQAVIAGRVLAVDETHLVLTDAIRIHREPIQVYRQSGLMKVPYLSRLVAKTTSASVPPVSIPGEVRVPRSSIQNAATISPEIWPSFRRDGIMRIGIDFDFSRQ